MKFVVVHPEDRDVFTINVDDTRGAAVRAGLRPGAIDHGTLSQGLGYIVDEHAMFEPLQHYFAIGSTLIAGKAVLYRVDSEGRTVDLMVRPHVRWFESLDQIEREIAAGSVNRPVMSLPNEPPFWQWPQPKPDLQEWSRRLGALLAEGHPIQIDDTLIVPIDDDESRVTIIRKGEQT